MWFSKRKPGVSEAEARAWFDRWQERLEAYKAGPKVEWKPGDSFVATEASFKGHKGTVVAVDVERGKMTAQLRVFGRKTPVELPLMDVEKLP